MANELEVLRIMEQYRTGGDASRAPSAPLAPEDADDGVPAAVPPAPQPEASPALEASAEGEVTAPAVKKNPWKAFLNVLCGLIPKRGDTPLEIVRKCVFVIALITLIGSVGYIVNDMVIIPYNNQKAYTELGKLHDPDNPVPVPDELKDKVTFKPGMRDSLKYLYALNDQTRGWITYKSTGKSDFLKIDYPIMFSGDNDYYLTHDFHKTKNPNGALFFDKRNRIESADDRNKVLIVYGHNMGSGQMFAGLNNFNRNENYARQAPVLTLETLFEQTEYKVFAAIVIDDGETVSSRRFSYLQTDFASSDSFLDFIDQVRARSLYDYPVDVNAEDELVILSTCTVPSQVYIKDGRLAVFARKVRPGESASVNTSKIVKNTDVIMPYDWYIKQKKEPHAYYAGKYTVPTNTITTGGSYTYTYPTGTLPTGTETEDPTVPAGPGSTQATTSGSGVTTPTGSATGPTGPSTGPIATTTASGGTGSTDNTGSATPPTQSDTSAPTSSGPTASGSDSTSADTSEPTTPSDTTSSETPTSSETTPPSEDTSSPSAETDPPETSDTQTPPAQ